MRLTVLKALVLGALLLLAGCTATTTGDDIELADGPLAGKFVWHDLITDDASRAMRFYGALFGWQFERTERLDEPYWIIRKDGRYVGGIVELREGNDEEYSRWLGYLSVPDVDEASRLTEQAGGSVVVAPLDLDIARAAAVSDPQGAVLGLLRVRGGDPVDTEGSESGFVIWNELLASDTAAAAAFYRDLAGVVPETIPRRGGEYTLLRGSGRERAGILKRPNDDIEPLWLTHFGVDDPAAAVQSASELGGKVLLAPSADFRESSMALVEDPGGAVLALTRFDATE